MFQILYEKSYIFGVIGVIILILVLCIHFYVKKIVKDELYKKSKRRKNKRLPVQRQRPVEEQKDLDSYVDPVGFDDSDNDNNEEVSNNSDDNNNDDNNNESHQQRPRNRYNSNDMMQRDLIDAS